MDVLVYLLIFLPLFAYLGLEGLLKYGSKRTVKPRKLETVCPKCGAWVNLCQFIEREDAGNKWDVSLGLKCQAYNLDLDSLCPDNRVSCGVCGTTRPQ